MGKRLLITFSDNELKLLTQLSDKLGEPTSVVAKNIIMNHLMVMELKLK